MRVLICEDQDAIRRMIEALIGSSGHQVVGVSTGAKAFELASSEHFDVLLLDLMLPGTLDGFEVCARLRALEKTREMPEMPIFVISAMDDPASKERALTAGATEFLSKPFRPLELLKKIGAVAGDGRTSDRKPR